MESSPSKVPEQDEPGAVLLFQAEVTEHLGETARVWKDRGFRVNRKLLVGFLLVLAVAPIGTLLATGILSPDASPSTSTSTTTLNATAGLTATVSTTVSPRIHQHYKVGLSISLGDCINPYGRSC